MSETVLNSSSVVDVFSAAMQYLQFLKSLELNEPFFLLQYTEVLSSQFVFLTQEGCVQHNCVLLFLCCEGYAQRAWHRRDRASPQWVLEQKTGSTRLNQSMIPDLAITAEIGKPLAIPLPIQTISGLMLYFSQAPPNP